MGLIPCWLIKVPSKNKAGWLLSNTRSTHLNPLVSVFPRSSDLTLPSLFLPFFSFLFWLCCLRFISLTLWFYSLTQQPLSDCSVCTATHTRFNVMSATKHYAFAYWRAVHVFVCVCVCVYSAIVLHRIREMHDQKLLLWQVAMTKNISRPRRWCQ